MWPDQVSAIANRIHLSLEFDGACLRSHFGFLHLFTRMGPHSATSSADNLNCLRLVRDDSCSTMLSQTIISGRVYTVRRSRLTYGVYPIASWFSRSWAFQKNGKGVYESRVALRVLDTTIMSGWLGAGNFVVESGSLWIAWSPERRGKAVKLYRSAISYISICKELFGPTRAELDYLWSGPNRHRGAESRGWVARATSIM
jgi:hypothetical protein